MKSQENKAGRAPNGHRESFKLPRSIMQVLRKCAEKQGCKGGGSGTETLKYLWMNISSQAEPVSGKPRRGAREALSPEDWLNVVDEAASLGVKCIVIRVGASLEVHPELWAICSWAQRTYGIDVGIHTCAKKLKKSEVEELKRLELCRTWLFVDDSSLKGFETVKEAGICVLAARVDHEEHSPPCDMSEEMVFVGPEGVLYTCGLVSDDDHFRMGHVSEKLIEDFVKDPALPHTVPEWAPHPENGCNACPPIMARRMVGASRSK